VDIGERLHIVPVIDEYIVDSAIISLPFGAQQIRNALKKRLQLGAAENSPVEHVALREIVHQSCYVSTDMSAENETDTKQVDLSSYSLGAGFNNRVSVSSPILIHITSSL
jgi:actin-related protein